MIRFRRLCPFFALLIAYSFALAQNPENQIEPIRAALRAHDYDKAVQLSRAALQEAPNNAQLWTLQGIAFGSKGDNKQALMAFLRALKISPNNLAALAGAAQIQYQQGSSDAIPLLNRLVQLRPADPTAHAMLGVLDYRQGNCPGAVQNFEKAGELIDNQLSALHAFATCLMKVKRLDAAIMTLQKAVALSPNDPRERQVLASLQLMDHKPEDALATLGPLLAGQTVDPGTLELASRAY